MVAPLATQPATQIPLPEFSEGTDSPAQFIKFLHSLINEHLGDNCPRILNNEKRTWEQIVDGICDHVLGPFPLPDITTWSAMQEKCQMVEATLELIRRVFLRVDGIYNDLEALTQKMFARLVDMCQVLDAWMEITSVSTPPILSPTQMRQKAFQVLITVLHGLGNCCPSADQQEFSWKTLRGILKECFSVCEEIMSPTTNHLNVTVVSLFRKPLLASYQDDRAEVEKHPLNIVIMPATRMPMFLTVILEVLVATIDPTLGCYFLLADIRRMVGELGRSMLFYFVSTSCRTTLFLRTRAIIRIIETTASLRQIPEYVTSLGVLPERLLQFRLDDCVKLAWDEVNRTLTQVFTHEHTTPLSLATVSDSIEMVGADQWNNFDDSVQNLHIAVLRRGLPKMNQKMLTHLEALLSSMNTSHETDALRQDMASLSKAAAPAATRTQKRGRWRSDVEAFVRDLIVPDPLDWMDDEDHSTEASICKSALGEIASRYDQRPLHAIDASSRLSLIKRVSEFPCILSQCSKTNCLVEAPYDKEISASLYVPLLSRLLAGSETEVTVDVRQRAYIAFSACLRHQDGKAAANNILDLLFQGMTDEIRSVRVSAGHALASLIAVYGRHGKDGYNRSEPIFARLYQTLEGAKNPVRESLLIAVGAIGKKVENSEILGQVICLLIAQLGRKNPVIKGYAATTLLTLAKHYKKSPYPLVQPYLDQIAPFIIQRLPIQPDILDEFCRVMLIEPASFVNMNLPKTLPELFATSDVKVLEVICKEVSETKSTLLVKHSSSILSHVFLLPSQSATTKALAFIQSILKADSKDHTIDTAQVVRSCVVPLLTELVVVLGHEDKQLAEQGMTALSRVERIVAPTKRGSASQPDMEGFLKSYMLGIISGINDILQDVHGKKSVSEKQKVLRSLGALVHLIGPPINNVAPQIMATFQTMVNIPELAEVTLESWYKFLNTLGIEELGPYVGPTSAAIVTCWTTLSHFARNIAYQILNFIINMEGAHRSYVSDIVDLSVLEELRPLAEKVKELRGQVTPEKDLVRILNLAANDNLTVGLQALRELKKFLLNDQEPYFQKITSGDAFDPIVGNILSCLFSVACRDTGEGGEAIRLLAFECIGTLGALDPDRCEINNRTGNPLVLRNFTDENESISFATHLIQNLLVGAFRSTSDIKYQRHLAFSIQELLKLCSFTPAIVGGGHSVPLKVRSRWKALPKHVLGIITPLLEGRFTLNQVTAPIVNHPIYPTQSTYREWLQIWVVHLISKAQGTMAPRLFGVFRSAIRSKDVVVAHHLLPHLMLHVIISAEGEETQTIRTEMITVLEDQINPESTSTSDKKLLSAQVIFMLLDHFNKWIRVVRQEITKKAESHKRQRNTVDLEGQVTKLDSLLSSIDHTLMAKAAFQCKAYARALMNFEKQVRTIKERNPVHKDLPDYYEKLHEIYAHLDEPDGMEGMTRLILSPTLEHQIREHESTGRWTSAQSCWEVRLQESPDNVEHHLGLLRCLRNLGHYDTLRTHVTGVLTRHPEWETTLAEYQVESAWIVGAWDDVERVVSVVDDNSPSIVTARVLLAMRAGDPQVVSETLARARTVLGTPITAAGAKDYRRAYESVMDLHLMHELELIYNTTNRMSDRSQSSAERRSMLTQLSTTLSKRLDFTLPTFRTREPLLSMRRTAFALQSNPRLGLGVEIGKWWLASAKIARKAKQWQTAYSATLQAEKRKTPYTFIESSKLIHATGDPLRAYHELDGASKSQKLFEDNVLDLTGDDGGRDRIKAKIQVLKGRWMNESERFSSSVVLKEFGVATDLHKTWESAYYHLGNFHDECFKALPVADQAGRGVRMNLWTIRNYARAILHGSKYVFQTIPRMLTIWLDGGDDKTACQSDSFKQINESMRLSIRKAPLYKWYTAFNQIVSRVVVDNIQIKPILDELIVGVLETYPLQALWLFTAVAKSTKEIRKERGKEILLMLQNRPGSGRSRIVSLVRQSNAMTNQLLGLCDMYVDKDTTQVSMSRDVPGLWGIGTCDLIIPMQQALTVSLPPTTAAEAGHVPFALDTPTFCGFHDEVEVMMSLARPRKIIIKGSDGQNYIFLGKPKDDLRKDARLMDFNGVINKLLKGNSESRRRQLSIRTYGVLTLNEECGFIQWVHNTTPLRFILKRHYATRGLSGWDGDLQAIFREIRATQFIPNLDASEIDRRCALTFENKILNSYKPVFNEWFIEMFPEPTAWLASRIYYGRSVAVMSIVGFVLGLGDRHTENILMDTLTGGVVHVDFNCLFEKGKSLETPERVPFRLTQNIVDGFGVSGVEGVFRISCELTLQLLRLNKDLLMGVLDTFVHDPLVEWEDERRKMERAANKAVKSKVKLSPKDLAKNSLYPIEKKLKGIYSGSRDRIEREMSTTNFVESLIAEATSHVNLSKMWQGWAPYF